MDKIIELIKQDQVRLSALDSVYKLNLPQCYIAAGFVRNLVWDWLHSFESPTPLNDVDVIYYDQLESDPNAYLDYEAKLKEWQPEVNWQVRNQVYMHKRNGDRPYSSTLDAMSFWVEKETAVAIRKVGLDQYECISSFGFESLFDYCITYNPKRSQEAFESRVNSKGWLVRWPDLKVVQ
ncbi:nitrate reductase [Vibrio sp. OCN044]|uniref:Nitrate reductase n=1 Tax=Vibrio tetraodonis subsp. pristinus TaxID=2695891 RepID=A0A6L8LXH7_9VIBR|nr:nucleotidyltransferase family protein [Vibrio tetraodonis]MYM60495.1 nitrate reductase [Vibrio tetraodonis subsp. pristinus]